MLPFHTFVYPRESFIILTMKNWRIVRKCCEHFLNQRRGLRVAESLKSVKTMKEVHHKSVILQSLLQKV